MLLIHDAKGLRHHFKNTYSVNNPNPNRLNELRQAQAYDEASAQLEDICARRVGQGMNTIEKCMYQRYLLNRTVLARIPIAAR